MSPPRPDLRAGLIVFLIASVCSAHESDSYHWNDGNFFPIGIYEYPTNYDGTPGSLVSQEDHLAELHGSGFSLARIWHGTGGLENNIDRVFYGAGIPGYAGGLAALVDIDTMAVHAARDGHDSTAEQDLRVSVINQGDNHPGLFAWHSADEPGPSNLVGAATEQQLIDELSFTTANILGSGACAYTPWDDSYLAGSPVPDSHPVLVNLGVRDAGTIMGPIDYGPIANSYSMEWYPNYQAYKTAPSAYPDTDRRLVGYYADQLQILSAANRHAPTLMVLEAAGGLELGGSPPYPPPLIPSRVASRPNRIELRFDAYSSIIHGANGVLWYGLQYTNAPGTPGGGQLWEDIKSIAAELGDSQTGASTNLRDALADNVTTADFVLGDTGLEATIKQWNGKQFLVVANTSYVGGTGQPVSDADITLINWKAGQSEVRVLFEGGRTIATADGSFQDDFAPWEVHVYESLFSTPAPWSDLGGATPGLAGPPTLVGSGTLTGGTPASIALTQAPANAPMVAWISFAPSPFMALGSTVHAYPFASQLFVFADGAGDFTGATTWPTGVPSGTQVWFQFLVGDPSTIHGITLSNGLLATTP